MTATGCSQGVSLKAGCAAALVLSMLLQLKKYLLEAYDLLPQRVAVFAASNAERRKAVRGTSTASKRLCLAIAHPGLLLHHGTLRAARNLIMQSS